MMLYRTCMFHAVLFFQNYAISLVFMVTFFQRSKSASDENCADHQIFQFILCIPYLGH